MKKTIKNIMLLLLVGVLITGCGKTPQLKNGEEAVVTIKNGGISADDLYKDLKDKYGLQALVNLIDKQILEKEYKKDIKDAENYAKSTIDSMINGYGGEKELLSAIQNYTNYSTIEAYQDSLYLSYLQNLAIEDYAKDQIKDKDIKDYYKNKIENDIEVSHILITPKVTDKMTDEEKTKAETAALNKAKEVIAKLKNSKNVKEDFKALAKEYSEDAATKDQGGSLGAINKDTLGSTYDNLVTAAYKLKDGKYSTDPIKTSLGYHVIIRTKTKDKAKLEDVESSIKETLAKDLISKDSTVVVKGLQAIRKKYDVEIKDEKLKTQYANYIQNSLSQLKANDNK